MVPVSDNQEVFTDVQNSTQLIIEILEATDKQDDEAIEFNFKDLADCNSATDSIVIQKRKVDHSTELPNLNIQ